MNRFNAAQVMSESKRKRLTTEAGRAAYSRMLNEGVSYQEAADIPIHLRAQDEAEFRAFMRKADQDLDWQCNTVDKAFTQYREQGEIPAPHYPMRIAILLRKAKEHEREKAFLTAWCRHFPEGPGGTYDKLAERARKLGVNVEEKSRAFEVDETVLAGSPRPHTARRRNRRPWALVIIGLALLVAFLWEQLQG